MVGIITFYLRIKKILRREGYEVSNSISMTDIQKLKHLISKTPKEKQIPYRSLLIGLLIHFVILSILAVMAFNF